MTSFQCWAVQQTVHLEMPFTVLSCFPMSVFPVRYASIVLTVDKSKSLTEDYFF